MIKALLQEQFKEEKEKEEKDFLQLPILKMQIRTEDLNATLALEYENGGTRRCIAFSCTFKLYIAYCYKYIVKI